MHKISHMLPSGAGPHSNSTPTFQQAYEDATSDRPSLPRYWWKNKGPINDDESADQGPEVVTPERMRTESTVRGAGKAANPSEADVSAATYAMTRDGRWHQRMHAYEEGALAEALLATAKPNIFWTIKQKENRTTPKKCVLSVATMQAMVVRTYQRDIVEAGKEMMDGKTSVLLSQLLRGYCECYMVLDGCQSRRHNLVSPGADMRNPTDSA